MIQQIVSWRDKPEHFPNLRGRFGFVAHTLGTRAGKTALRGSAHWRGPAEAQSRNTSATICGSASTPQRTLPIFSGKTNRKRPARVFLSAFMAAIKRTGEVLGHGGSGPTCAIKRMSRSESFAGNIPEEAASFEAAIIPQPTASPWRYLRYRVTLSSACANV